MATKPMSEPMDPDHARNWMLKRERDVRDELASGASPEALSGRAYDVLVERGDRYRAAVLMEAAALLLDVAPSPTDHPHLEVLR